MSVSIEYTKNQKIEDTRVEAHIALEKTGKFAILRPTGFGKTTIMCDIAKKYNHILYIYPTEAIKKVACEKLVGCSVDWLSYYSLGTKYNTEHSIDNLLNNKYDLIIFDEIHHMGAELAKQAIYKMLSKIDTKTTQILGGTATPVRSDTFDVVSEFFNDNITSFYGLDNLIEDGLLPQPHYVYASRSYEIAINMLEIKRKKLSKSEIISEGKKLKATESLRKAENQIALMLNMPDILDRAVKYTYNNSYPSYMKFIVFFTNKSILKMKQGEVKTWFKGSFEKLGYTINTPLIVHSDDTEKDNIDKLSSLVSNDKTIDLIFCVNMLNEGYHVDNLTGCILLRPTKSKIVYAQQVGRCFSIGMSYTPLIIDLVENLDSDMLYAYDFSKLAKKVNLDEPRSQKALLNMISTKHLTIIDEVANVRKVLRKLDIELPDEIDDIVLQDREHDMVAYQIFLDLKENRGFKNIKFWQVLLTLEKYTAKLKSLGLELKYCDRFKRGIEDKDPIEDFDKHLKTIQYEDWSEWVEK